VMAGPRRVLAAEERAWMEQYLSRGGRLLFLADGAAASGVEDFLVPWGVRVSTRVAVSPRTLSGFETVVRDLPAHTVTRNMGNLSLVFGNARCLEIALPSNGSPDAGALRVEPVARTDKDGWGEADPARFPRVFDPERDQIGPVVVAAAVERGGHVASDLAFRSSRLLVVGDAGFVNNGMLNYRANANLDFVLNGVNWLAGFDVGGGTSLSGDMVLALGFTREQWMVYLALSVAVLPLAVFAAAALFGRRRS